MPEKKFEKATFGAGCFWGVQSTFDSVKGVKKTEVGYAGGDFENPTYEDVSYRKTGHAEVLQVEYNPDEVSYDELLDVFWKNHNPTTLNRQGADVGSQYRSAIFFHTPDQEKIAKASKAKMDESGKFKNPIVTEITSAGPFYRAEEYHQKYDEKRGQASCHL